MGEVDQKVTGNGRWSRMRDELTNLQYHCGVQRLRNEGSRSLLGCWCRCWRQGTPGASTGLIS